MPRKRRPWWAIVVWIGCCSPSVVAAQLTPANPDIDAVLQRDLPLPGAIPPQSTPQNLQLQLRQLEARWNQLQQRYPQRPPVSLKQALQIGLAQNPILAQSYAELIAAEWSSTAVRREWLPSLYFTQPNNAPWAAAIASQSTNQSTSNSAVSTSSLQQFYTSPRLTMMWTFLDPTRVPRFQADQENVKSKRLLFDVSTRSLILDIQQSYYTLQEARELHGLYAHLYDLTRAQVQRSLQFRAQGVQNQQAVSQLRAQLLQQLVQLISIYQQELQAANQLASNMSLNPGDLRSPSDQLSPVMAWSSPLQTTIDEALKLREEIRINLAQSKNYSWKSLALMQGYLPLVSLMGQEQLTTNSQLQFNGSSPAGSSTLSSATLSNSIGLTFNWLLYDGGIDTAKALAFRQQAAASQASAGSTRLLVTLQVQNNYASFLTNQIIIQTAQDQVYAARDAVQRAALNYNGTTIGATIFIQSIQNYVEAVKSYKAAVKNFNIAVDSLYRYSSQLPPSALQALAEAKVSMKASP